MKQQHFRNLLLGIAASLISWLCLALLVYQNTHHPNRQDYRLALWLILAALALLQTAFAIACFRSFIKQKARLLDSLAKAKASKEEFRHFIENSHDILFSLDWDLRVQTVNRVVTEHLGLSPKRLLGLSLIDIMFFTEDSWNQLNRDIVMEKIDLLRARRRKKVKFKVYFQMQSTGEIRPYLLELSLGRKHSEADPSKQVIYGRAQSESVDTLLSSFRKERRSYAISNSLIEAEELSQTVTENLRRYISQEKAEELRVAVRELILNAIEHGNLAISYEEKTKALGNGSYLELFRKRREDPRFSDKKVFVDFFLNPRAFFLHIKDQGSGFDYEKFMKEKAPHIKASEASHGRGLMLADSGFHKLRFQHPGNELTALFLIAKDDTSRKTS